MGQINQLQARAAATGAPGDPLVDFVQKGVEMMGVAMPVASIYIGINALIMLMASLAFEGSFYVS